MVTFIQLHAKVTTTPTTYLLLPLSPRRQPTSTRSYPGQSKTLLGLETRQAKPSTIFNQKRSPLKHVQGRMVRIFFYTLPLPPLVIPNLCPPLFPPLSPPQVTEINTEVAGYLPVPFFVASERTVFPDLASPPISYFSFIYITALRSAVLDGE